MSEFNILACITVQKSCERMIREGAKLAEEMQGELYVLHVATQGRDMLGYPDEADALEYLYQISSEYNAEMTVLRARDVVEAIVQFVRKKDITAVLTGIPSKKGGRNLTLELSSQLPGILFQTVYTDD